MLVLKAVAKRLSGGWQSKVNAHKTARRTQPSRRIQTIGDRVD